MAAGPGTVKRQDLTNRVQPQQRRKMAQPPPPIDKAREERLAEALRENLRKRKAQARDAKAPPAKD
jgi:hypothetical protein